MHDSRTDKLGMTLLQPHPISKAAFPVAGLGTRLFPASKVMAKERLAGLSTNYMPMQTGDVPATSVVAPLLQNLSGDMPPTRFRDVTPEKIGENDERYFDD